MSGLKKTLRKIITIRSEIDTLTYNVIFALSIITLIIVYSFLAYDNENKLLPTWDKLWVGLKTIIYDDVWEQSFIWIDTKASLGRLIPSVAVASLVGVVLGLYMGVYSAAEAFFARGLIFMGNIPPNAVMVAFMIYFGFGVKMYMSVIIFGIVTMIARSVFEAVKAVSNEHIYGAKTLDASSSEIVWSIVFFQVLPQILEAIRQSIAPALIFLIATEWASGNNGFGYRFMMLQRTARMELIFPYIMYLGVMGVVTMLGFRLVQILFCPWYVKES